MSICTFDQFKKLCVTTPVNMQQGVQTYLTCNIQQCCVRLHRALDILRFACGTGLVLRNCTTGINHRTVWKTRSCRKLVQNLSLKTYREGTSTQHRPNLTSREMENNIVYTSSGVKGALGLLVPNHVPRVLSYPSLSLYRDG